MPSGCLPVRSPSATWRSRSTRAAPSSTELLVAGTAFYPRMLADIEAAESSIHINQFGFKPGAVGDSVRRACWRARRPRAWPCGSSSTCKAAPPSEGSRELYERLTDAGADVCVVRATKLRAAVRSARRRRCAALEPARARPLRPSQDDDRRRPRRLGRWRRASRTTSATAASTICSSVSPVRWSTSLRSCSSPASGGWAARFPVSALDDLFPMLEPGARRRFRPSCCTTRRASSVRSRRRSAS